MRFTDPRRLIYKDEPHWQGCEAFAGDGPCTCGRITPKEVPESEVRWGKAVSGHEHGVRWGQLHPIRRPGDDTPYVRGQRSASLWAYPINFEETGE